MAIIEKSMEVELTEEDIADLFCQLDSDEQAIFFNKIHEIAEKTWKNGFAFQMAYINDSKFLSKKGRQIIEIIGEYAFPRTQI